MSFLSDPKEGTKCDRPEQDPPPSCGGYRFFYNGFRGQVTNKIYILVPIFEEVTN